MRVMVLGSSRWTAANATDEIVTAHTGVVRRSSDRSRRPRNSSSSTRGRTAPRRGRPGSARARGRASPCRRPVAPRFLPRPGRAIGRCRSTPPGGARPAASHGQSRPRSTSPKSRRSVPTPLTRLTNQRRDEDGAVLGEQRDREVDAVGIETARPSPQRERDGAGDRSGHQTGEPDPDHVADPPADATSGGAGGRGHAGTLRERHARRGGNLVVPAVVGHARPPRRVTRPTMVTRRGRARHERGVRLRSEQSPARTPARRAEASRLPQPHLATVAALAPARDARRRRRDLPVHDGPQRLARARQPLLLRVHDEGQRREGQERLLRPVEREHHRRVQEPAGRQDRVLVGRPERRPPAVGAERA